MSLNNSTKKKIDALEEHWRGIRRARDEIGFLDPSHPQGVTVAQYCQKFGISRLTAVYQLDRMVDLGFLTVTKVRDGYPAKIKNCYSPVRVGRNGRDRRPS